MTNEPAYKFIAYAHKPMFGMNTIPSEVEYTLGSHDASRDDMLDAFRYFLMAAGYSFSPSESIQVVDEDWEDAQVEAEEDLPSIKVANFQGGDTFWTDEAEEGVEVKWDAPVRPAPTAEFDEDIPF